MKEQLTHINEKVNEMLKKIGMMVFAIILLANISFCADTYKTIYNPFTYTMDYVMDSFGNLTIENLTVDNIFAGNSTGYEINMYSDLILHGNLTVLEYITAVNVSNVFANGSIIPLIDSQFDLGNTTNNWRNVYIDNLYATNLEENLDGTGYNVTVYELISTLVDTTNLEADNLESNLDGTGYNITIDTLTAITSVITGSINPPSHTLTIYPQAAEGSTWTNFAVFGANASTYGRIMAIYGAVGGVNEFIWMAHNGSDGRLVTGAGDLYLEPNSGDVIALSNITADWFKGLFNWTDDSDYLSFDGAILSFNETELNDTIDARELDTFWNITGSKYLYNDSGILEVNETTLNATIDSSPTFVEVAGDSMTGDLNMTDNNIYNVSEIHFDTGFIIRGAP